MPMMSSTRSSIRSPRRARGGSACGGNGPRSSVGASVMRRKVAIAANDREVLVAGRAHRHLDASVAAVTDGVRRHIADAVAAPVVAGDLAKRLDHRAFRF